MQTRKATRKNISLPGRYFNGLGMPQDVTLLDLSVGGCRFAYGERKPVLGSPLQIFVGASGPHHANIKWIKGEEVGIRFSTPLSEEHFESIEATQVSDTVAGAGGFDDMVGKQQRRFC